MHKISFLIFVILCYFPSVGQKKTNVLVILVDDMAWNDPSYRQQGLYETPNIDALSKVSYRFDNAYAAASICSPTRAALLTGNHPARLAITDWIPGDRAKGKLIKEPTIENQLPLEQVTLAEMFKEQGYVTFFAGKWHLGGEGFLPEQQGFDQNFGGNHTGTPKGGYYSPYLNPQLSDGPEGEYLADRLSNELLDFIERNKEEPFFAFLPYYTVHTPIQGNKSYLKYFQDKKNTMAWEESLTISEPGALTRVNKDNVDYASMLYAMDVNIGKIIQGLKDLGIYDQTLIVFTSDNGGLSTLTDGYNRPGPTSVLPLRGGKGWLYEGGIKVPLLIKPAEELSSPKIQSDLILSQDLFPTILDLAGVESLQNIDGVPIDFGPESSRRTAIWYYPHYHGSGWKPGMSIRESNWKLIYFFEGDSYELYDLIQDPEEQKNVSSSFPTVTQRLYSKMIEDLNSKNARWPSR